MMAVHLFNKNLAQSLVAYNSIWHTINRLPYAGSAINYFIGRLGLAFCCVFRLFQAEMQRVYLVCCSTKVLSKATYFKFTLYA